MFYTTFIERLQMTEIALDNNSTHNKISSYIHLTKYFPIILWVCYMAGEQRENKKR